MSKYSWKNEIDRVINGRYNRLPEVFFSEVPPDIFSWLKNAAEQSKEKNIDTRRGLIGHINEEYNMYKHLNTSQSIVQSDNINFIRYENFIKQCAFNKYFEDFWDKTNVLTKSCELKIISTWVNFQKKHEFNPPHNHSGVMSWIIFLNIPYNLEDEDRVFPMLNMDHSQDISTSRLSFLQVSPIVKGGIDGVILNVDKSFEGKILMFPSYIQHQVFPFYTSDDYRITISGNASFDVDKSTS